LPVPSVHADETGVVLVKMRSYRSDIAITDIRMPSTHGDEGIRAAEQIRAQFPEVGVLVLSQYVELRNALALLSDSAERIGYLLEDRVSDVNEFRAAVRHVAEGCSAIDPAVVVWGAQTRFTRQGCIRG
jgi:DNA-binding NarL/FixJ family response regulator